MYRPLLLLAFRCLDIGYEATWTEFSNQSFTKQLGRYASPNHNIYIAADHAHVDVDHAAHAFHCIVNLCVHTANSGNHI